MISVLRLGHRIPRDARITTHCALVARAFGAKRFWVDSRDAELENSLAGVVERWGGDFEVRTDVSWRSELKAFTGLKVHLTMYGEKVGRLLEHELDQDVLFVIGAEKVPREVYELCDLNLSVGNQPHSEVAALAIALDRWTEGSWPDHGFPGGHDIVPHERGKVVVPAPGPEDDAADD